MEWYLFASVFVKTSRSNHGNSTLYFWRLRTRNFQTQRLVSIVHLHFKIFIWLWYVRNFSSTYLHMSIPMVIVITVSRRQLALVIHGERVPWKWVPVWQSYVKYRDTLRFYIKIYVALNCIFNLTYLFLQPLTWHSQYVTVVFTTGIGCFYYGVVFTTWWRYR